MLEVFYDKKKVSSQYLKPTGKPVVKYPFELFKLYTLIMHDPDAPAGNVMHWVVVNLSSTSKGKEIMKYRGPAPPPGSGIHRYIFLLYEQQEEEKGREIEIPNVIPMKELLELLKLQDSRLLSTVEFMSSNNGKGGSRGKSSSMRKKKNGSLRKRGRGRKSSGKRRKEVYILEKVYQK
jgi:hypothetical protein